VGLGARLYSVRWQNSQISTARGPCFFQTAAFLTMFMHASMYSCAMETIPDQRKSSCRGTYPLFSEALGVKQ